MSEVAGRSFLRKLVELAGPARLLGERLVTSWGASSALVEPGLHAFHIERDGGETRLHLRVEQDGSGVLFVNVSDVVHLSPTAVDMAWLAIEGVTEQRALSLLSSRYSGVARAELRGHYDTVRRMVDTLSDPRVRCPTCSIELPKVPLFSTKVRAPYKVDLALTYACDNACPHCYNEPRRFSLAPLDTDQWKEVIDRLVKVGVPHLILTGGEPTLHPGVADIVAHASTRGLVCGMNTNGRRLADGHLLDSLVEAGLDHVQITLHSANRDVHDAMVGAKAHEETLAGLKAALNTKLHVLTNTTLTKASFGGAAETVRFLHGLGLRSFAMNAMIHSGGGTSSEDALPHGHLAAILVEVRETAAELGMRFLWYTVTEHCQLSPLELEIGAKRCNAAEYSMCVEPSGDVIPCQSYYQVAGNIFRDSFESIWDSELFRGFRDRGERPGDAGLPATCAECPDFSVCGGGCRLEREARKRRVEDTHLSCDRLREKACSSRSSGTPAKDAGDFSPHSNRGSLRVLR